MTSKLQENPKNLTVPSPPSELERLRLHILNNPNFFAGFLLICSLGAFQTFIRTQYFTSLSGQAVNLIIAVALIWSIVVMQAKKLRNVKCVGPMARCMVTEISMVLGGVFLGILYKSVGSVALLYFLSGCLVGWLHLAGLWSGEAFLGVGLFPACLSAAMLKWGLGYPVMISLVCCCFFIFFLRWLHQSN